MLRREKFWGPNWWVRVILKVVQVLVRILIFIMPWRDQCSVFGKYREVKGRPHLVGISWMSPIAKSPSILSVSFSLMHAAGRIEGDLGQFFLKYSPSRL